MAQRPVARTKGRPKAERTTSPDKLNDAQRAEIVTRLAMYDRVADIVADLAAQGVDISHQAIAHYNADNNPRVAERWRQLFLAAREKWQAEMAAEPIAHRAMRLRRLGQLHDSLFSKALAESDPEVAVNLSREARAALEQAAKEVGNVFSNVSKSVGVVAHQHEVIHTIEEKRNMLADRLEEGLRRIKAAKAITG